MSEPLDIARQNAQTPADIALVSIAESLIDLLGVLEHRLREQPTPAPEPEWTPQPGELVRCYWMPSDRRYAATGRYVGLGEHGKHKVALASSAGDFTQLFARVEPATPTGGTVDEEPGVGAVVRGMGSWGQPVIAQREDHGAWTVTGSADVLSWEEVAKHLHPVTLLFAPVSPATPTGGTVDEEPVVVGGVGWSATRYEPATPTVVRCYGHTVVRDEDQVPDGWWVRDGHGSVLKRAENGGWTLADGSRRMVADWSLLEPPLTLHRPATPDPTPQPVDPAPDGDEVEALARAIGRAYGVDPDATDDVVARAVLAHLHARGWRQVGDGQVVVDAIPLGIAAQTCREQGVTDVSEHFDAVLRAALDAGGAG